MDTQTTTLSARTNTKPAGPRTKPAVWKPSDNCSYAAYADAHRLKVITRNWRAELYEEYKKYPWIQRLLHGQRW